MPARKRKATVEERQEEEDDEEMTQQEQEEEDEEEQEQAAAAEEEEEQDAPLKKGRKGGRAKAKPKAAKRASAASKKKQKASSSSPPSSSDASSSLSLGPFGFVDSFDEEFVGDERDRAYLASLSQVEREEIVYNRSEERRKLEELMRANQRARGLPLSSSSSPPPAAVPSARSTRSAKLQSDSEASSALRDIQKRRHHQSSSKPSEAVHFDAEDDEEPLTKVAIPPSSSSSRPVVGDDEQEARESARLEKVEEEEEEEGAEKSFSVPTLRGDQRPASLLDLLEIQLRRDSIVKVFEEPYFEDVCKGMFARVVVGMKEGQQRYRLGEIVGVETVKKKYIFPLGSKREFDSGLRCRRGNSERVFPLNLVSNSSVSAEEFAEFVADEKAAGRALLTKEETVARVKSFKHKRDTYEYTPEVVAALLEKRNSRVRSGGVSSKNLTVARQELETKLKATRANLEQMIAQWLVAVKSEEAQDDEGGAEEKSSNKKGKEKKQRDEAKAVAAEEEDDEEINSEEEGLDLAFDSGFRVTSTRISPTLTVAQVKRIADNEEVGGDTMELGQRLLSVHTQLLQFRARLKDIAKQEKKLRETNERLKVQANNIVDVNARNAQRDIKDAQETYVVQEKVRQAMELEQRGKGRVLQLDAFKRRATRPSNNIDDDDEAKRKEEELAAALEQASRERREDELNPNTFVLHKSGADSLLVAASLKMQAAAAARAAVSSSSTADSSTDSSSFNPVKLLNLKVPSYNKTGIFASFPHAATASEQLAYMIDWMHKEDDSIDASFDPKHFPADYSPEELDRRQRLKALREDLVFNHNNLSWASFTKPPAADETQLTILEYWDSQEDQ